MKQFSLSMIDDPALFKVNVLGARSDTVICDEKGMPRRPVLKRDVEVPLRGESGISGEGL